jgi:histidine triad (HIT) family protein
VRPARPASDPAGSMGDMSEQSTGASEPSVFSRIVAREIPADIVHETDTLVAFRDIDPQAPVHLLVVPKTERHRDVVGLAAGDPALLAEIVATADALSRSTEAFGEHAGGEFRLVFNTGPSAGQTVFHVHAHVLGGPLQEGTLDHQ